MCFYWCGDSHEMTWHITNHWVENESSSERFKATRPDTENPGRLFSDRLYMNYIKCFNLFWFHLKETVSPVRQCIILLKGIVACVACCIRTVCIETKPGRQPSKELSMFTSCKTYEGSDGVRGGLSWGGLKGWGRGRQDQVCVCVCDGGCKSVSRRLVKS